MLLSRFQAASLRIFADAEYVRGRLQIGHDLGTDEHTSGGRRLETEAGEGTRTLDLRLGKPTLYQLSYARIRPGV